MYFLHVDYVIVSYTIYFLNNIMSRTPLTLTTDFRYSKGLGTFPQIMHYSYFCHYEEV